MVSHILTEFIVLTDGVVFLANSYTKFLACNQTHDERTLHLDSDSTVSQSMDELFLIPPVTATMPHPTENTNQIWPLRYSCSNHQSTNFIASRDP